MSWARPHGKNETRDLEMCTECAHKKAVLCNSFLQYFYLQFKFPKVHVHNVPEN